VTWLFSNWKPPVLWRNRTELKPQFSGGHVKVFFEFQKWPSPITKVRNNNVITGHAGVLPPPSQITVWQSEVESLCSLITDHNGLTSRWVHQLNWQTGRWRRGELRYYSSHNYSLHLYYIASDCWSSDSSEKCKRAVCHIGLLIGLRAVFNLSYATQRTYGLRHNQKLKNRKTQRTQPIQYVCALRCVQQLGNWSLSPFS